MASDLLVVMMKIKIEIAFPTLPEPFQHPIEKP
jgi:hypothetical protein